MDHNNNNQITTTAMSVSNPNDGNERETRPTTVTQPPDRYKYVLTYVQAPSRSGGTAMNDASLRFHNHTFLSRTPLTSRSLPRPPLVRQPSNVPYYGNYAAPSNIMDNIPELYTSVLPLITGNEYETGTQNGNGRLFVHGEDVSRYFRTLALNDNALEVYAIDDDIGEEISQNVEDPQTMQEFPPVVTSRIEVNVPRTTSSQVPTCESFHAVPDSMLEQQYTLVAIPSDRDDLIDGNGNVNLTQCESISAAVAASSDVAFPRQQNRARQIKIVTPPPGPVNILRKRTLPNVDILHSANYIPQRRARSDAKAAKKRKASELTRVTKSAKKMRVLKFERIELPNTHAPARKTRFKMAGPGRSTSTVSSIARIPTARASNARRTRASNQSTSDSSNSDASSSDLWIWEPSYSGDSMSGNAPHSNASSPGASASNGSITGAQTSHAAALKASRSRVFAPHMTGSGARVPNATSSRVRPSNAPSLEASGSYAPAPNTTSRAHALNAPNLNASVSKASASGTSNLNASSYKVSVSNRSNASGSNASALNRPNLNASGSNASALNRSNFNALNSNASSYNASASIRSNLNASDYNATAPNRSNLNASSSNASASIRSNLNASGSNATVPNRPNLNASGSNASAPNISNFNASGSNESSSNRSNLNASGSNESSSNRPNLNASTSNRSNLNASSSNASASNRSNLNASSSNASASNRSNSNCNDHTARDATDPQQNFYLNQNLRLLGSILRSTAYLDDEISGMCTSSQNILRRLCRSTGGTDMSYFFPELPLSTFATLAEFDRKLRENPAQIRLLTLCLLQVGGGSCLDAVGRVLNHVITGSLQPYCVWSVGIANFMEAAVRQQQTPPIPPPPADQFVPDDANESTGWPVPPFHEYIANGYHAVPANIAPPCDNRRPCDNRPHVDNNLNIFELEGSPIAAAMRSAVMAIRPEAQPGDIESAFLVHIRMAFRLFWRDRYHNFPQ